MNISVSLATFNNCHRLQSTLNSFCDIVIPADVEWELIVVDNNSNDSTKKVIDTFSSRLPIKYIFEPEQGLSRARNASLRHARGDLIIFTDDDVTPCPNWLKTYWEEYLLDPSNSFFGGPIISDYEEPPKDMTLISLGPCSVKGLNLGAIKRELAVDEFFIGPNWAAPSKAVNDVGGFNVHLGLNAAPGRVVVGEESDLMNRLREKGLRAIYIPDCTVRHFVPKSKMTLEHIASRAEASGRFYAEKFLESSPVCFFGVPRWMFKKAFYFLIKSKLKKIINQNSSEEYITYRQLFGSIKHLIKNKVPGPLFCKIQKK